MCVIIERERKEIQTERIKIYQVIGKQRKIIEGSDISKIVIMTEIQTGKVFTIKRFPLHSFDTSVCKLRTQLIKRPFFLSGYMQLQDCTFVSHSTKSHKRTYYFFARGPHQHALPKITHITHQSLFNTASNIYSRCLTYERVNFD